MEGDGEVEGAGHDDVSEASVEEGRPSGNKHPLDRPLMVVAVVSALCALLSLCALVLAYRLAWPYDVRVTLWAIVAVCGVSLAVETCVYCVC
jgi:hypothetical protein